MSRLFRRDAQAPLAPRCVLIAGILTFLAGILISGPSSAAPSSFLEMDGNVRSNGGLDWGHSSGVTGTGGAFSGGLFVNSTTVPTPPVATVALTADTTVLSNSFTVDPLASDVTVCGTGDSTVFTGQGGEKNGDLISTMTFGTASVPPKDDLSNVYAFAHDLGGGAAEVFFGAERIVNNGDSHVDFELLHGTVSRSAGCSGSFTGNRSQGDLLFSVDFENGGGLAGTQVYQWHCADEGDPQPADGTVCNPPATGPSVPHYEDVSNVAAVKNNVSIRVNDSAPIDCGGWACRASNGSQINSIPTNAFIEGAINLAGAGFTGCLSTLLPHTRSSDLFGATLKDFAGPMPLTTCPTVLPSTTTTTSSTTTTTVAPTTTTSSTTTTTTTSTTEEPTP